jgi:hypothetical protein
VSTHETTPVWAQTVPVTPPVDDGALQSATNTASEADPLPALPMQKEDDPEWAHTTTREGETDPDTDPKQAVPMQKPVPTWAQTVPAPLDETSAPERGSSGIPAGTQGGSINDAAPPPEVIPAATDIWPPDPPTEHTMPAWPPSSTIHTDLPEATTIPADEPIESWPDSFDAVSAPKPSFAAPARDFKTQPPAGAASTPPATTEPPSATEPPAEMTPTAETTPPAADESPAIARTVPPAPASTEPPAIARTVPPSPDSTEPPTIARTVPPAGTEPPAIARTVPPAPAAAAASAPPVSPAAPPPAAVPDPPAPAQPEKPAAAATGSPAPSAPVRRASDPSVEWPAAVPIPAWAPRIHLGSTRTDEWKPAAQQPAPPASQPAPAPQPAPAGQQPATQQPVTSLPIAQQPAAASTKSSWEVVEQKQKVGVVKVVPTPEDRSYAEWFSWAKRGGAPASACHAAAQGAFQALSSGKDVATAVQWATAAMARPPVPVSADRQTYCAWFSLANIDLNLDQHKAHAFATAAVHALDAGADAGTAHAAGLAAAGIR